MRQRAADYVALTKPRVVMMVLVTTLVGYYLGTEGTPSLLRLLHTLLGTALAAGGTLALNQYAERDLDARMDRTRHRPLPDGRVLPVEALVLGITLLVGGLGYLQIAVGAPAALVTTAISATYLLLYTPLCRPRRSARWSAPSPAHCRSPAGPRAAPSGQAWVLFAIMYLWQIPTRWRSAACIATTTRAPASACPRHRPRRLEHRDPRGGELPASPPGRPPAHTPRHGRPVYFATALVLGLGFLWSAIGLARTRSLGDARRLLVTSLIYLPVLLATMALDKLPITR